MDSTMLLKSKAPNTNVNQTERLWSVIGGSGLIAYGLIKRNTAGYGLAALGGSLLYRGVTGHCEMYRTLGVNTAERGYEKGTGSRAGVPYQQGIRVDQEMPIHRSPEELYKFWRNLENLPRFMDHLESVRTIDDRTSHWVAKGPAGLKAEWDAEIVNDVENEVIGWRSLEGSQVANGGSVRFERMPESNGTVVRVSLQYIPPAGQLGAMVARLFGENPERTIAEDLRRFKELMETGNITSTAKPKRSVLSADARRSRSKSQQGWDRDAVQQGSEESFPASDPPSWTPEAL